MTRLLCAAALVGSGSGTSLSQALATPLLAEDAPAAPSVGGAPAGAENL